MKYPTAAALTPAILEATLSYSVETLGAASWWRFAAQVAHVREGAQMWVSQEVLHDLMCSDIDVMDMESVPWPADRLEMVFEDPTMPSFLFQRGSRQDLIDIYAKAANIDLSHVGVSSPPGRDKNTVLVDILAQTEDDMIASACLDWVEMLQFATGASAHDIDTSRPGNFELNQDEETALRKLAVLGFKVLLFASSEGFEPRRTMEPPTRKQGGKPGFKGRPKTPRFIVEYLPGHITDKKAAARDATAFVHEFRGRRGHWRTFRSPRFVNKQGTRQFMAPVPGPDGTVPRRNFRVVAVAKGGAL